MSTKVEINTIPQTLLNSPLMTFFSLLAAVVIGSSLLEFNELLFPPKVSSISFWALIPVYVVALDAWFGVVAWTRNVSYTDKPILRTMTMLLVLAWINLLALMYFASRAHISPLSYLWGLVVLFVLLRFVLGPVRIKLMTSPVPEPNTIHNVCTTLSIATATGYSIWLFAYPPVPDVMNWVFVMIAFSILIGFRLWMKVAHIWRPEEKK